MPRTSWRDDMVTATLCGWVVAGMTLDAWAHQNLDRLETFFTPWHAVLYSGFAALLGWIVARVLATGLRRGGGVPVGYGLGLAGAGSPPASWPAHRSNGRVAAGSRNADR